MKKVISLTFLIVAFIIFIQSVYILDQTKQSVVVRFGEPVNFEKDPGLKFKLPFVDNVLIFDNRILDLNADPKEVIALDQKRLIVDAFAKFKIIDALKFVQTVRNEPGARSKLNSILESTIRQKLGQEPLNALLQPGKRADIMNNIQSFLNNEAKTFGIEVIDVRIMRADLPSENSQAIYRRMQTEREKEAREFRAEGSELAQVIVAKAEREKIEILANAKKESEIIRGQADAEATKIFADSFGKDTEFYGFYKSLEAYKESIAKDSTNVYLSPDNDFFQYFGKL